MKNRYDGDESAPKPQKPVINPPTEPVITEAQPTNDSAPEEGHEENRFVDSGIHNGVNDQAVGAETFPIDQNSGMDYDQVAYEGDGSFEPVGIKEDG